MKTFKIIFLLLLILFPLTKSLAQKETFARAEKEYNLLRYKTAIPYYLKGLKKDSLNQTAVERLADSYRNIKDYKNAEIWYAKAVSLKPGNPDINLHYAEVLANNGKYAASEMWYQKYVALNSSDTRAGMFAKTYADVSEFYTDSAQWRVRFTSLNTGFDEFSPVFFKQGLIITSNRSSDQIKYISGSDMKPFTDLYYISDTNSIRLIDPKEQAGKNQNMVAMIRDSGISTAINDNRALGYFNIKSLSGITEYDYDGKFTPATQLKGNLKSKLNDGPASFSSDESWMMFTRNNKDKAVNKGEDANKLQLFSAHYNRGKWSNIESFPYNSNEYSAGHPALSADGNILYFVSDMPGGYGGTDLYYCIRMGYRWSKPVNLGDKVNTLGDEMFPFLDRQNNLYFSSTGLPGLGGLDIFYVPIKDYLPSGQPKNLGYPVNSSKDDFGIVTTSNGLSGYFSSNRRGDDDIYRFDVSPTVKVLEVLAETKKEPIKPVIEQIEVAPIVSTNTPIKDDTITSTVTLSDNVKPYGLKEYNERGIAVRSDDKNIDGTKLLVLHQTAPIETVMKITNPINGKSVFAKVVGKFTENANTKDAIVVLTKAAADQIGALDRRFQVIIDYSAPVKDEPVKLAVEPVKPTPEPAKVVPEPAKVVQEPVRVVQEPAKVVQESAKVVQKPTRTAAQPVRSTPEPTRTVTQPVRSVQESVNGTRISLPENIAAVTTVSASSADAGNTFSFSLSGGADAAKFRINSSTGALTFISAPDFEKPGDADANNTYIVIIRVSDGTNYTDQTLTVIITDVNDNAPVITSNAAISIPENSTVVTTVTATDADAGTTFSYSLDGGADAAKFRINSSTGALSFISAPDFEKPADADANNIYIVSVRVNDGANPTNQTITVSITDVNDNTPVITSNPAVSIAENLTAITTVTATDADAGTILSYSLSGGADMGKFRINSSTGALSFISAPDFEKPADADANNIYIVSVRVNDGTNSTGQTLTVTVTDANDNTPVINSSAAVSIPENTTGATMIRATDADAGTTFGYSLSGGADIAKFRINNSTGALTFISAPDFEKPADADANNIYIVVVRVSDGTNTTDQTIMVTITDVNDNAPVITSNAAISIPENSTVVTTVTATDADAGTILSYSLSGGADMAKFHINNSTGALTFVSAPDFEKPADADANNIYIVVVRVSDGTNTTNQTITVSISDVNDNAPAITSNATISIPENITTVTTVRATDADEGTTLSYSLTGGADMAKFRINSSTGALTFISAPDFEQPADADANNKYIVVVRASDGTNTTDQTVIVTITDVNDNAPVITSNAAISIPENSIVVTTVTATDADAGTTFRYSLTGGADMAKFRINSSSGALTFISAPDFERPGDADANNKYILVVRVSDGINTADQTVTVTITDVNDNTPVITSNAAVSVPENTTTVITLTATDADAGTSFSYSLSGGADAAKFRINSRTGALTFISAPDYEQPADADANNKYIVVIRVSDGTNTADQTMTVTVTDVNDSAPVIKIQ